jgi:hypothetical protein
MDFGRFAPDFSKLFFGWGGNLGKINGSARQGAKTPRLEFKFEISNQNCLCSSDLGVFASWRGQFFPEFGSEDSQKHFVALTPSKMNDLMSLSPISVITSYAQQP